MKFLIKSDIKPYENYNFNDVTNLIIFKKDKYHDLQNSWQNRT